MEKASGAGRRAADPEGARNQIEAGVATRSKNNSNGHYQNTCSLEHRAWGKGVLDGAPAQRHTRACAGEAVIGGRVGKGSSCAVRHGVQGMGRASGRQDGWDRKMAVGHHTEGPVQGGRLEKNARAAQGAVIEQH